MMIWKYDEHNILIDSMEYTPTCDEEGNEIPLSFRYTMVSPLSEGDVGTIPYRPRFDESTQTWVEDMTEEEIREWKEENKTNISSVIKSNEELTRELKSSQEYAQDLEMKLIDLEIKMYEYM